jgi:beta-lactamase class A
MPISELIQYTVAQSDNVGCDVLLRLIGGTQVVQKYMDSKGAKNFRIVYNRRNYAKCLEKPIRKLSDHEVFF